MRIRHSDEYNPAGCSVCGKVFKNKYSLRAHINIYHKEHTTINTNNQGTYQMYNNITVGQQQQQQQPQQQQQQHQQHPQSTPIQQQPVNNSAGSYLNSTSTVTCFNQSPNSTTTGGYIIQQPPSSPFLNKITLDLPTPYQLTNQAASGPPLSPL